MDDVYEPLGSQEKAAGEVVGLREGDEGFLERSSHTHPPAQCCWCLKPGTMVCVCVRTTACGDAHLLKDPEDFHPSTKYSHYLLFFIWIVLVFFLYILPSVFFLCRQDKYLFQHIV